MFSNPGYISVGVQDRRKTDVLRRKTGERFNRSTRCPRKIKHLTENACDFNAERLKWNGIMKDIFHGRHVAVSDPTGCNRVKRGQINIGIQRESMHGHSLGDMHAHTCNFTWEFFPNPHTPVVVQFSGPVCPIKQVSGSIRPLVEKQTVEGPSKNGGDRGWDIRRAGLAHDR